MVDEQIIDSSQEQLAERWVIEMRMDIENFDTSGDFFDA